MSVFTVQVYTTQMTRTVQRPIDLSLFRECSVLLEGDATRAFRMLFGFEKNGFDKNDKESIEEKFVRLIPELGITTNDMDALYSLVVNNRLGEYERPSVLYKFGIFFNNHETE